MVLIARRLTPAIQTLQAGTGVATAVDPARGSLVAGPSPEIRN